MTSADFHKSLAEAFALDNIAFEKLSTGSALKKWIEGHTGHLLYSPVYYRSSILPDIARNHQDMAFESLKNQYFWLAIDGGQDK